MWTDQQELVILIWTLLSSWNLKLLVVLPLVENSMGYGITFKPIGYIL